MPGDDTLVLPFFLEQIFSFISVNTTESWDMETTREAIHTAVEHYCHIVEQHSGTSFWTSPHVSY